MTFNIQEEITKSRGLAPKPPAKVQENRINRTQKFIDDHNMDGVLVYGSPYLNNEIIRYLSGYVHIVQRARSMLLIPKNGEPILFTDRPWHKSEAEKMSWIDDIRTIPSVDHRNYSELSSKLKQALKDTNILSGTIGAFRSDMPAAYMSVLENAAPKADIVDADPIWHDLVTSPTDYDLDMISKTASIADEGLATVVSESRAGVSEREICINALDRMAQLGAEFRLGAAVSTHVNTGAFSEVLANLRPFLFTGNRLEHGQMFWTDLVACYNGYYIDCDRTICVGEPSDEQQDIFDIVEQMYESMVEKIAPGVEGGEVWQVGYDIAEKHGYGDAINFVHQGHPTGLMVSESSIISEGVTKEIPSGSVINIEPGIFVPGVGSANIENAVYVSENNVEQINELDNGLFVV